MLKKLSSMLIALSIVLSMITVGYAADTTSAVAADNEMAIKVLTDLEIITEPTRDVALDSASITRAEYVDLLVQVLLKTNVTETKLVNPYDDVYEGHPYFSSICYAYGVGIIDGGEKFNPDAPADLEFALNATAGLLGYRFIKSYIPSWTGYISRNDLTKNFTVTDGLFSKNDAYTMVLNALGTDCIQLISGGSDTAKYGVVDGETLGGKYFDLGFVSGRLVATEYATMTGDLAGAMSVTIGDKSYLCKLPERFAYLGMYVDAVTDEGGEVIAMAPVEKDNETIVIEPDSFVSYESNKITYYKGTALKKVNLDNATIVYNGVNVVGEEFSNDLFDISEGTITVVKNKSGKADVILIDEYNSFIISAVASDSDNEYKIYASNISGKNILLDLNEGSTLKDANGAAVDPATLTRGQLLTYKTPIKGEFVEAIVSANTVTAAASGKKTDASGTLKAVTISGVTYDVTKDLNESNVNFSDIQATMVWYITPFGNIGAVDYSTVNVDIDGYLTSVFKDDAGESAFIKVVDSKNNELDLAVKYQLKKKVKLDGDTVSDIKAAELLEANTSTNIAGKVAFPIVFRVNEEGTVYQIDTPYMGANEDPKLALQEVVLNPRWMYNEGWLYLHPGGQKARIEGKYYLGKSQNLYAVTNGMTDVYLKSSLLEAGRYMYKSDNFKMYRKGNKTYALNCCVYITDSGETVSTDYNDRQFYMVDKITEVVNSDGETTLHFDCIYKGTAKSYDVNPVTYEKYPETFDAASEGDLLQLAFDDNNQIIGLAVKVPYKARNAANGGMSGVNLQWEVKHENPDDPNEVTFEGFTNGNTNGGKADYSYNNEDYQMFGKVYRIEYNKDMGKYLVSIFTSKDYDEDTVETFTCDASAFVLYDSLEHTTVDPSAIKTYEDFGNDCDTLFACIYYSNYSDVMFFRTY